MGTGREAISKEVVIQLTIFELNAVEGDSDSDRERRAMRRIGLAMERQAA